MSLFLDQRYADMLSPYLEGFTLKSSTPYRANCRCMYCGDSQKRKSKKRGWLLQTEDFEGLIYFCHNCNISVPFWKFIENIDASLAHNYSLDKKKEFFDTLGKTRTYHKPEPVTATQTVPKFKVKNTREYNTRISDLPDDHPVKRYVAEVREVPKEHHPRIYYSKNFSAWINTIMPDRLPNQKDPRLVMPIISEDRKIVGVSARTLLKNREPRYINIMFDESSPKTYGLDMVDWTKKYYVVEGAMDSFFLPNCIAINGSSINFDVLKNSENAVFVLDNQCRDKGVVRTMERVIAAGLKVCVWPNNPVKEDINDMVKRGIDPVSVINENTYEGVIAKMNLDKWRRV